MEMVKLKNGSEELKSLVAVVMASIKKLNPLAAYDLIMLCRDRDYRPWGEAGNILKSLCLVTQSGDQWHVHCSIRNIVLSAADGEGIHMSIGSPVA